MSQLRVFVVFTCHDFKIYLSKKVVPITDYYFIGHIFDQGTYCLAYPEQWGDHSCTEAMKEKKQCKVTLNFKESCLHQDYKLILFNCLLWTPPVGVVWIFSISAQWWEAVLSILCHPCSPERGREIQTKRTGRGTA